MKEYLSKTFYLTSFIAAGAVNFILSIMLLSVDDMDALPVLLTLTLINIIYIAVVGSIMWYKSWSTIQDGHARTTPGKAVGFLFIPLFNLYWVYQVIVGFSRDCNAYIDRHTIAAPKLPEQFFKIATITVLCGVVISRIPVLGLIYSLATMVIMIMLARDLITTVNQVVVGQKGEVPVAEIRVTPTMLRHPRAMAIAVIAISGNAILHQFFFMMHWYGVPVLSAFLGILSFAYWGIIMYLGWRCEDTPLRLWAILLPIIPLCLQLFQGMRYLF